MKQPLYFIGWVVFGLFISCTYDTKNAGDPHQTVVQNQGVRIDYLEYGQGDTTLLFIHGWGINKTYWDKQLAYFRQQYRVVAMDLPGFGLSGKNRDNWSMEEYGRDVAVLTDALDLKNIILIGHSMGGDIILEAAILRPDRVIGLIGIDNFKDIIEEYSTAEKESIESFMSSIRQDYRVTVSDYFNATLFSEHTPEKIRSRVMGDLESIDSLIAIATIESVITNIDRSNRLLREIPYKLWLINSDYTPTNTEDLEKYCPKGFEVLPIQGTGHYPMIEKPDEFNRLLKHILGKSPEISGK